MFTGIITHTSRFRSYLSGRSLLCLEVPRPSVSLSIGDSLAVNGVCLSLVKSDRGLLMFNVSQETLGKTTLGALRRGERLNLELPLTLSSPLGGHLVTGHVDGTGKVKEVRKKKDGTRFTVSFPSELKPFFVSKGSVALDGVSLTVAELGGASFDVEAIPITLEATNLSEWKRGRSVNIECDIIGKYVYNWTSRKS